MSRGWILQLVDSRWFALADFAIVASALALWIVQALEPRQVHFGGWPLLLAIVPWGIRLAAGRFPFQRTSLEIPIFVFMLTAAVGLWAAHDKDFAWVKFWLIIGGILIFYALVGQPQENRWLLVGTFGMLGVAITAFFLLTHDWGTQPAKVEAINDIALWWMALLPTRQVQGINPNAAAGIAAMMTPFLLAFGILSWRKRRIFLVALTIAGSALLLIGLILTTSRGAWVALGSVTVIWALWILSGYLADGARWSRARLFSIVLTILTSMSIVFALTYPGGILALIDRLPGPARAESRLELARETLELISDFPITGGGLGSFPGLYSQYILNSDALVLEYGHNMYLDIILEVGPVGFLAFISMLIGSVWLLMKRLRHRSDLAMTDSILLEASLAALIVISIHGLVDYAHRGAPFFFLAIGMAIGLSQDGLSANPESGQIATEAGSHQRLSGSRMRRYVAVALVLAASLAILLVVGKPLLAAWHANLGALQMARVELADWPSSASSRMTQIIGTDFDESSFLTALELDPTNRTAHHRLGLVALANGDYVKGVSLLEQAFRSDESHRGVWRPLGYGYIWLWNLSQTNQADDGLPLYEFYALNDVFGAWLQANHDPIDALLLAYEALRAGDEEFARAFIERAPLMNDGLADRLIEATSEVSEETLSAVPAGIEARNREFLGSFAIRATEDERLGDALLAYQGLQTIAQESGVGPLARFLWHEADDFDLGELVLRQSIASYPTSNHVQSWQRELAELARAQNRWEDAEQIYEQLLAENPEDWASQIGLGWLYYERGDGLNKAIVSFSKAVEMEPNRGDGYFAIGQALTEQSDYAAAEIWYERALQRSQDKRWWYVYRAENATGAGKSDLALEIYQDLLARFPTYAIGYFQISWAYRLAEQPREAIEAINRAIELTTNPDQWMLVRAGEIYEWVAENDRAAEYYRMALAINVENDRAREGLRRLESNQE